MNYGLSMLFKENKFFEYDAFFLLTNDTELENKSTIETLLEIFKNHKRLGILSPCSHKWGEKTLLKGSNQTKYFWFIHNNSYFLRISQIILIFYSMEIISEDIVQKVN